MEKKDSLAEILEEVVPYGGQGYSWNELKSVISPEDKQWLRAMAYMVDTVDNYDPERFDELGPTAQKLKEEIIDKYKEGLITHLMCEIGMALTSVGDAYPEEEGE